MQNYYKTYKEEGVAFEIKTKGKVFGYFYSGYFDFNKFLHGNFKYLREFHQNKDEPTV